MHKCLEVTALKFSADLASAVRSTRGENETIRVPLAYKYSVTMHDTVFFFNRTSFAIARACT